MHPPAAQLGGDVHSILKGTSGRPAHDSPVTFTIWMSHLHATMKNVYISLDRLEGTRGWSLLVDGLPVYHPFSKKLNRTRDDSDGDSYTWRADCTKWTNGLTVTAAGGWILWRKGIEMQFQLCNSLLFLLFLIFGRWVAMTVVCIGCHSSTPSSVGRVNIVKSNESLERVGEWQRRSQEQRQRGKLSPGA